MEARQPVDGSKDGETGHVLKFQIQNREIRETALQKTRGGEQVIFVIVKCQGVFMIYSSTKPENVGLTRLVYSWILFMMVFGSQNKDIVGTVPEWTC